MIRVHRIIERTRAEGPGTRFCIWVQGCSRHCTGCFAKETWDKGGGTPYEESAIIGMIRRSSTDIEGITLLGGEPFEQAKGLAEIAEASKDTGLSVVTFTGYAHEELILSKDSGTLRLLKNTDILIDGPYKQELRSFSRPLAGSSNQRFIFLSDRYSEDTVKKCENTIEIRIQKNGAVYLNGMGQFEEVKKHLELNLQRGEN